MEEPRESIRFSSLDKIIEREGAEFIIESTNLIAQAIDELNSDMENLIHVIEQTSKMDKRP